VSHRGQAGLPGQPGHQLAWLQRCASVAARAPRGRAASGRYRSCAAPQASCRRAALDLADALTADTGLGGGAVNRRTGGAHRYTNTADAPRRISASGPAAGRLCVALPACHPYPTG
jgi:hypothetical protein